MGRKEDEEDQGKVSKNTNGSIEELTKKCKPLNVQLSRLEIPKNGIILIKDNGPEKIELRLNSNDGELSDSTTVSNADKTENEDNSNDTAETIKKIKEFIALGRCEESKKDNDSSDKKVGYKVRAGTKRKLVNKKISKTPSKKLATSVERLDAEQELEKTLESQDSVTNFGERSNVLDQPLSDKKNKVDQKQSAFGELKTSDNCGSLISISKNDMLTPSRVSKRIQSKSVKFSVKKMLRGDDINVLKRMIPGYQDNIQHKKERLTEKKVKNENRKVSTPVKSLSPTLSSREPSQEKEVVKTPSKQTITSEDNVTNDNSVLRIPSPEVSARNSVETLIESKEKLAALSDKIGKFAIGNGKITVELKGSQQKKVLRIALPPTQTQSPLPNTSLGPDIIIKRVKPVKKTVIMPENCTLSTKGIIEKELVEEHSPPNIPNILTDSKMLPRVNIERLSNPKLKENLVKMRKKIFRHSKMEKRSGKADKESKKHISMDETTDNVSQDISTASSLTDLENVKEIDVTSPVNEQSKATGVATDINDTVNTNDIVQHMDTVSLNDSLEKSCSEIQEEIKKSPVVEKTRGKKTAKVTPLTQVKSKSETVTKKPVTKVKKHDVVSERSPNSNENELIEPEKETYKNLFDRYFSTKERYVEHHDSLDSDSSEDYNDEIYAHFINLRKQKDQISNVDEKKDDIVTMYDLMQDIALELPTWNIHVTSDGQAFCLAQVDIVDNVPVMKKVIEIDLGYNAKVFVSGSLMAEFEGNYSGYEEIRQLIYDVDQL